MREIAKRILKFEVSNIGESIFFFLVEAFGHRVVFDAHSRLEAILSYVILNEDWFRRPARSKALVEIQARQINVPIFSNIKINIFILYFVLIFYRKNIKNLPKLTIICERASQYLKGIKVTNQTTKMCQKWHFFFFFLHSNNTHILLK